MIGTERIVNRTAEMIEPKGTLDPPKIVYEIPESVLFHPSASKSVPPAFIPDRGGVEPPR